MFLWNRTDTVPFFLQRNQFVSCFLPISTSFQSLCFLHQFHFLLEVVAHVLAHSFKIFCFFGKESITSSTETIVDLLVHLMRSETDGLPFCLKCHNLFTHVVPVSKRLQCIEVVTFDDFTDSSFLVKVLVLFFLARLKIFLMAFVDNCRCILETMPNLFA